MNATLKNYLNRWHTHEWFIQDGNVHVVHHITTGGSGLADGWGPRRLVIPLSKFKGEDPGRLLDNTLLTEEQSEQNTHHNNSVKFAFYATGILMICIMIGVLLSNNKV